MTAARSHRSTLLAVVVAVARAAVAALLAAALVLLALGREPTTDEWVVAAVSVAAGALGIRALSRIEHRPAFRVSAERSYASAGGLGARLGQAVALDDLLPELAEDLRTALHLDAAEIWTGYGGLLERTASAPHRGWATLSIAATDEPIIARARVVGRGWLGVWIPGLVEGPEGRELRVCAIADGDELLGLIVAERDAGGKPFAASDESALAEVARQIGLAMRNVHLSSQLEASLDEVRRQAEQLRASRTRIVSAADNERRRIEQNLHDGAQQHLVGLGVKLGLARVLARSKPERTAAVLDELGHDVETALDDLRELAHGIYPPLLSDRGLNDALAAVARRAPLPTRLLKVDVGRHPPQLEATVYFCCVEALQNAGKHAGPGATATLRVWEEQGGLRFEVVDDGTGFDPARQKGGHGLTNMADRLGAVGGSLRVRAAPGSGARVTGTIPLKETRSVPPGRAAPPSPAG
jgi:signal transduction histidine kinase